MYIYICAYFSIPRVYRSPLKQRGHVTMDICTPSGQARRHILARTHLLDIPSLYTAIRKTTWGGLHPILSAPGQGIVEEYSPLCRLSTGADGSGEPVHQKQVPRGGKRSSLLDGDEFDPEEEDEVVELRDSSPRAAVDKGFPTGNNRNLLSRPSPFTHSSLPDPVSPPGGPRVLNKSRGNAPVQTPGSQVSQGAHKQKQPAPTPTSSVSHPPSDSSQSESRTVDLQGLQDLMRSGRLYDLLTEGEDGPGDQGKGPGAGGRSARGRTGKVRVKRSSK